jgi:hypothetical protein
MPTTTPEAKLWVSFGNFTTLALSIPLDKCGTFSLYPLKWLRFLGIVIYGREGHLSLSERGSEIDDYTAHIQDISYYFVSPGKMHLLILKHH